MSLPPLFALKKYLLLVLITSAISLYIYFMVLFTLKMNSTEVKENADEHLKGDFKPISNAMPLSKTALVVLISINALFILLQIIGLIGVYRCLFTLTCAYVLLQFAITVVGFLLITFYGSLLWAAAGWSLLVLVFALVYLRDLYLIFMEGEQERQQAESERQVGAEAN